MNRFLKVKKYYDMGLWSAARVRNAVDKGWITLPQYEEIVKEKEAEGNE